MSTSFPSAVDSFEKPAEDQVMKGLHTKLHVDTIDAIVALQEKVGADESTDPDSHESRIRGLETANVPEEDPVFLASEAAKLETGDKEKLDSALQTETDPVFSASEAAKLESGDKEKIDSALQNISSESIGDLEDVDTSTADIGEVFMKGPDGVFRFYPVGTTFDFSIASFTDNETDTQLIGAGVWRPAGDLAFGMTYVNGPPTTASIALTSDGGVTWASALVPSSPFASAVSDLATNYPSGKDKYIQFALTAEGLGSDTEVQTVIFRNNIKWGVTSSASGWDSTAINALSGTALSNSQARSVAISAGAGEYLLFAFPSSYASIHATGFLFNGVTCPFESVATVSVTNSAGKTEDYKVYRSTLANLGNSTLTTSTSSNLINPIFYGVTTKTSGFLESDIEGLASSTISNTKGRTVSITAGSGQYLAYALPARLGSVTFFVGGFEGGFEAAETVSITNVNGYTEDYRIYRSTQPNLGTTSLVVV
jgi:hypothetical protein